MVRYRLPFGLCYRAYILHRSYPLSPYKHFPAVNRTITRKHCQMYSYGWKVYPLSKAGYSPLFWTEKWLWVGDVDLHQANFMSTSFASHRQAHRICAIMFGHEPGGVRALGLPWRTQPYQLALSWIWPTSLRMSPQTHKHFPWCMLIHARPHLSRQHGI